MERVNGKMCVGSSGSIGVVRCIMAGMRYGRNRENPLHRSSLEPIQHIFLTTKTAA